MDKYWKKSRKVSWFCNYWGCIPSQSLTLCFWSAWSASANVCRKQDAQQVRFCKQFYILHDLHRTCKICRIFKTSPWNLHIWFPGVKVNMKRFIFEIYRKPKENFFASKILLTPLSKLPFYQKVSHFASIFS